MDEEWPHKGPPTLVGKEPTNYLKVRAKYPSGCACVSLVVASH